MQVMSGPWVNEPAVASSPRQQRVITWSSLEQAYEHFAIFHLYSGVVLSGAVKAVTVTVSPTDLFQIVFSNVIFIVLSACFCCRALQYGAGASRDAGAALYCAHLG